MKKCFYFIFLFFVLLSLAACSKNSVTYNPNDEPSAIAASLAKQNFSVMFQSYAFIRNDSKGTVWCAPFAGIRQFDLPKSMAKAKGTIRANGGSESIPGSGLVAIDVVYLTMPETEYKQLTDSLQLASVYAQANSQFLLQYQLLANNYQSNLSQLFSIYGVKNKGSEEELRSALRYIYQTYGRYDDEKTNEILNSLTIYPAGKADDYYFYFIQSENDKGAAFENGRNSEYLSEYEALRNEVKNYSSAFVFSRPAGLTELNLSEDDIIKFVSNDIKGNEIRSESLFSGKKVTMMNIWSTTCSVCLTEMPVLEKMNSEFSEKGGQVVGLLYDGEDQEAALEAKSIIEELGITYTNIIANDALKAIFPTQSFPMTYFFDENGKLIGDPVIGANLPKYRELMEEYTR